jgi:hypothetical protein
MSRRYDNLDDRDRYKTLSERAVDAIRDNFVDQNNELAGSLEQLASGSGYRDGAVTEAFTWRLIPSSDPIATATINGFSFLKTAAGGYKRVEGSGDPYDTDEWILIDLRASDLFRAVGQTQQADNLLAWVVGQASVNNNLIPELYNTSTSRGTIGAYAGSIPMVGYGAGAYQLSVLERVGSHEFDDCGTVDPDEYPDAGPIDVPDAGGGGGGDGGFGIDGRTGTACVCNAGGGSAPSTGSFALFALVLGAGLIARRRR